METLPQTAASVLTLPREELRADKSDLALQEPSQGEPYSRSGAETARKGDVKAAGVKVSQTATTWASPFLKKIALYNNICDKCLCFKDKEVII